MYKVYEITPDTDYSEVKECDYKGEHYSVRDNGAIYRYARDGKPKRKYDELWTFGIKDLKNGYMHVSTHRVHIIVANAFHGVRDSKIYVVDHIDTNRCNNRPDNLRWLTRLENALLNPATRKKIEYLCGSIENFINNPSCLRDITGSNHDVMWMRTVSKEEAIASYNRIMNWASRPSNEVSLNKGKMGEWMFNTIQKTNMEYTFNNQDYHQSVSKLEVLSINGKMRSFVLNDSLTPNAIQGDWRTPTDFLRCPPNTSTRPLEDYYSNLKLKSLFSRNTYGESIVLDYSLSEDKNHLWVMTENTDTNATKRWAIAEIILHDNHFLHLNRGSFFEEMGARKHFSLEQGNEWVGGDCFDDLVD